MAGLVRSEEEFGFESVHEKDIIRVAAYHRRDFDLAVIRFNMQEHEPIRRSMSQCFRRVPTGRPKMLESLPIEILHEVCLLIDVASLLRFRQINLRTREVVSVLYEYRAITSHALGALCAVLRTGLAPRFTIRDLYTMLSTQNCLLCGNFGGFVFLPSFTRCCFACIKSAPQFRMLSLMAAKKKFGLSLQLMRRSLPVMYTVPGIYSMDETPRKRRIYIVAEYHAVTAIQRSQVEANLQGPSTQSLTPAAEVSSMRFLASTVLPYVDKSTGQVQYGVCCKDCQIALETGLIGSRGEAADFATRDRVYSLEGFLRHFRWCAQAQNLWASSQGGTLAVEEPEATRRGGYFKERDVIMSY
jgi:hypothetical protein